MNNVKKNRISSIKEQTEDQKPNMACYISFQNIFSSVFSLESQRIKYETHKVAHTKDKEKTILTWWRERGQDLTTSDVSSFLFHAKYFGMGLECKTHGTDEKFAHHFNGRNLKERYHFRDLGANGRTICKHILKNKDVGCRRIPVAQPSGGLCCARGIGCHIGAVLCTGNRLSYWGCAVHGE